MGRADDGVVSWMIKRYPAIGIRDDVPLPVVAECDDQGLNDIQGRHVHPDDVVDASRARARRPVRARRRGGRDGDAGLRVQGRDRVGVARAAEGPGGYTVGVLLNLNTSTRRALVIEGVPVGRLMLNELTPTIPKRAAALPTRGRAADGSTW